jgi:hypothetical protein
MLLYELLFWTEQRPNTPGVFTVCSGLIATGTGKSHSDQKAEHPATNHKNMHRR